MIKTIVSVVENHNKIESLDQVLEESRFFDHLETCFKKSGKKREEFMISIKPNIMMLYSVDHPHVITDVDLVEHLVKRLNEERYTHVKIVESRNFLSEWFPKRTVKHVAEVCGYRENGYEIIDLSEEAEEHDYESILGNDYVGKTWKNSDYRISFAKNKTHSLCACTLSMKNIFGTLPPENKMKRYHKGIGWAQATIDVLRNFPPDFGFIDAFWSSDGMNGAYIENPKHTKTLIGGNNVIAVDWVGTEKMGIDPLENPLVKMAVDILGKPNFKVNGNLSQYKNWNNSSMRAGALMEQLDRAKVMTFLFHLVFMRLTDSKFK